MSAPRQQQVIEAVEAFLDEAISHHYDSTADETLTECHVCNEWEGHKDWCFIPAIEGWLVKEES